MSKYITKNAFNIVRKGSVIKFLADTVYEFDDNEAQVLAEHLAEAPKKVSAKSAKVVSTVDNTQAERLLERLTKHAELVEEEEVAASTNKAKPKEESLG